MTPIITIGAVCEDQRHQVESGAVGADGARDLPRHQEARLRQETSLVHHHRPQAHSHARYTYITRAHDEWPPSARRRGDALMQTWFLRSSLSSLLLLSSDGGGAAEGDVRQGTIPSRWQLARSSEPALSLLHRLLSHPQNQTPPSSFLFIFFPFFEATSS